jgi:hypothetical protein
VLNATITSRAFSSGFDIRTPIGIYSAKKVPLSSEIRLLDASDNQAARLQVESFLSSVYTIIITGGGFYRFGRDGSETWICEGEGRLFRISETGKHRFLVIEGAQQIAECKKSRWFNDYEVDLFSHPDLKLMLCVFVALSELEYQSQPAQP